MPDEVAPPMRGSKLWDIPVPAPKAPPPPPPPARIIMRTPAGRRKSVPESSVQQATEQGWEPETPEQRAAELSSVPGAFARSALAGAGDLVLAGPKVVTSLVSQLSGQDDDLGGVTGRSLMADARIANASTLRADVTAHPTASMLGEIAGQIPGMAIGGGALVKAAAGAAKGLGVAGHAAHIAGEVGASALLGAGTGLTAASEQAWVKNEKLTGQAALAAMGSGALFGAAAPVALMGLGKGLSAVKRALRGKAGAAETVVSHADEVAHGAIDKVDDSWIATKLRAAGEFADEKAVDAITRGQVSALSDMPGAVRGIASEQAKRRVGEMLHDMGIVKSGFSSTEMAEAAMAARKLAGRQIGAITRAADDAGARVDTTSLKRQAYELLFELDKPLTKEVGLAEGKSAAREVRTRLASVIDEMETGTLTHRQLHGFRKQLDKAARYTAKTAPSDTVEAIRTLRSAVNDTLGESLKSADPGLGDAWVTANERFGVAKWAEKQATKQAAKSHGTTLGLNDYVTAAGALAASGGNPLITAATVVGKKLAQERGSSTMAAMLKRAAAGSVDVAAAPSTATRYARTLQAYGINTADAADTAIRRFLGLDKAVDAAVRGAKAVGAATSRGAHTAVELGTHHTLEHGAHALMEDAAHEGGEHVAEAAGKRIAASQTVVSALRSVKRAHAMKAFAKHAEEVALVTSNPHVAMDRIRKLTGEHLPRMAPRLHTEIVNTAGRAAQYLKAHMPGSPKDSESPTPHLSTRARVSAAELRTYANRVEAVESPHTVLEDIKNGRAFPEKIEAVRTVYPALYAQWQQMLVANLSELKEPLPHDKRVVLEVAFGGDGQIESSMNRRRMAATRKAAEAVRAEEPKQGGGPPPGKSPVSTGLQTTSERIASR